MPSIIRECINKSNPWWHIRWLDIIKRSKCAKNNQLIPIHKHWYKSSLPTILFRLFSLRSWCKYCPASQSHFFISSNQCSFFSDVKYSIIFIFLISPCFGMSIYALFWDNSVHNSLETIHFIITSTNPCKNCNTNKFVMQMDLCLLNLCFLTVRAVCAQTFWTDYSTTINSVLFDKPGCTW